MEERERPIGVFDSGIGGLTVLDKLIKYLPNEHYLYIGDLKNSPYGEKTKDQIIKFTKDIIDYFVSQNVKMVVVACNTASSFIDEIRCDYDIPIVTVMDAAIKEIDNQKNILLAATKGAIDAGIYLEKIRNANSNANIYSIACRDIVPAIENEDLEDFERQELVDKYIKDFRDKDIDLLILGCTHYPILKNEFQKSIGEDTFVFDPAENVAEMTYEYLKENDILGNNDSKIELIVTKDKERFEKNIRKSFSTIKINAIVKKEI